MPKMSLKISLVRSWIPTKVVGTKVDIATLGALISMEILSHVIKWHTHTFVEIISYDLENGKCLLILLTINMCNVNKYSTFIKQYGVS